MKKLTLLLFIAGLFVISFTNTNCKRPDPGIVPISGDTQNTTTKIDSNGEDVHVTVKMGSTASTTTLPNAVVYLVNNQADEDSFNNNVTNNYYVPSNTKKFIKVGHTDGNGVCTFKLVKPISGFEPFVDPTYGNNKYTYYVHANYENPTSFIHYTGYNDPGNGGASNPITVSINNGSLNLGLQVTVAVN